MWCYSKPNVNINCVLSASTLPRVPIIIAGPEHDFKLHIVREQQRTERLQKMVSPYMLDLACPHMIYRLSPHHHPLLQTHGTYYLAPP
jgi:hypothetical protein